MQWISICQSICISNMLCTISIVRTGPNDSIKTPRHCFVMWQLCKFNTHPIQIKWASANLMTSSCVKDRLPGCLVNSNYPIACWLVEYRLGCCWMHRSTRWLHIPYVDSCVLPLRCPILSHNYTTQSDQPTTTTTRTMTTTLCRSDKLSSVDRAFVA